MINSLAPEVLLQILDALPVRIFWKDRESRYIGCNQLFADDAGIADPQEFVGKSDFYFYHPDQARAFRDHDADVMYSGVPRLNIEEKLTRATGEVIWLDTNKLPLRDAAGAVIGVLGMYHVITERKRADAARCEACLIDLKRTNALSCAGCRKPAGA